MLFSQKSFWPDESKFSFTVKFSIKSFKVPELYIEVPEMETIGSLKVFLSQALSYFFLINIRCVAKSRKSSIFNQDYLNLCIFVFQHLL